MITVDHSIFYKPAFKAGVDITKVPAEVAPAAHTSLGGLRVDEQCETSVRGLFAAGEIVGGIHGANRIGGNAGTETLVFGARAGMYAASRRLQSTNPDDLRDKLAKAYEIFKGRNRTHCDPKDPKELKRELRTIMQQRVGVARDNDGLTRALKEILELENELEKAAPEEVRALVGIYDLENMIATAKLIILAARERTESRGAHNRRDFPRSKSIWRKNVVLKRIGENVEVSSSSDSNFVR
jgi:fumarate reductase (CoM/CoB) subunit A